MQQQIIFGILRHVLTALGGTLLTKGWADPTGVSQIVGAVMTLIGVAWSIGHKAKYCGNAAGDAGAEDATPGNGGNFPGGLVKLLVFGLLTSCLLAPAFAADSNLPAPAVTSGVNVPVLTPGATALTTLLLNGVTNAPNAVRATLVTDLTAWFLAHGSVYTGVGITAGGAYGAIIGQLVTVFLSTNKNEFAWVVTHSDFYDAQGGCQDEFGTGLQYTFAAPAWLSNFVIITTKPSTFTAGLSVSYPTTCLIAAKGKPTDLLFGPSIGWKF